jgi:hypothetical protein
MPAQNPNRANSIDIGHTNGQVDRSAHLFLTPLSINSRSRLAEIGKSIRGRLSG